eukprot:4896370-Amphidinium_carterae.1
MAWRPQNVQQMVHDGRTGGKVRKLGPPQKQQKGNGWRNSKLSTVRLIQLWMPHNLQKKAPPPKAGVPRKGSKTVEALRVQTLGKQIQEARDDRPHVLAWRRLWKPWSQPRWTKRANPRKHLLPEMPCTKSWWRVCTIAPTSNGAAMDTSGVVEHARAASGPLATPRQRCTCLLYTSPSPRDRG